MQSDISLVKIVKNLIVISNQDLISKKGAAFARILCYAKSLSLTNGIAIYLCSLKLPLDLHHLEEIAPNVFLVGKPNSLNISKIYRNLSKFYSAISSIAYFYRLNKTYRNSSIRWIVFPISLIHDIIIIIFVKVFRKELIFCEKNELKTGIVLNYNRELSSISGLKTIFLFPFNYLEAYLNDLSLFFYDGVIAISKKVQIYSGRLNKNVIRIPILTQIVEVQKDKKIHQHTETFSLCFAGTISTKKEGLLELLQSLAFLKQRGLRFVLHLFGNSDKSSFHKLSEFIKNHDLQNEIIFKHSVPHEQMIRAFSEYDLLIMSRQSNRQSEYGFSTKLAEYLSSGTAVLVTDVSDNGLFIQDGLNGFLVKPGEVEEMAEKLFKIITGDYDLSHIGTNGRETAIRNFDFKIYSEILKEFLFK